MRLLLLTSFFGICFGWYLPSTSIVQRSSSTKPIIRIFDPRTDSEDHEFEKSFFPEHNWLPTGQDQPVVDEISYLQSFVPPRKAQMARHEHKLQKEGVVNPNHFHFRVTK